MQILSVFSSFVLFLLYCYILSIFCSAIRTEGLLCAAASSCSAIPCLLAVGAVLVEATAADKPYLHHPLTRWPKDTARLANTCYLAQELGLRSRFCLSLRTTESQGVVSMRPLQDTIATLQVATAALLGRLASQPLHGPRVQLLLERLLPPGVAEAVRDGPGDAAVQVAPWTRPVSISLVEFMGRSRKMFDRESILIYHAVFQ